MTAQDQSPAPDRTNPAMPSTTQRLADRAQRSLKKLSWKTRALPDFVIVGTQKGGTSSLHAYLSQHPRMFPGDIKEVHFFDGGLTHNWDKYAEGERLYRSYFPKKSIVHAAKGLVFEATPNYMHNPPAIPRMASLLPNAKVIALLRDPVDRAISNYFHEKRRGRETRPMMDALLAEDETLDRIRASGDYKNPDWNFKSYVSRGLYADQLETLFEHYDRDRVLVLESSEFYAHPQAALSQVLDFVGMQDNGFEFDLTPVGQATNRTKVDPNIYDWLIDRFKVPNQRLEQLLGRSFNWVS